MFIDKFYRLYNPYPDFKTEGRSSSEGISSIYLEDGNWIASDHKISSVKNGELDDDVSTLGQTLTRKGESFVQGKHKYEFLESKDGKWNAKKRKICNVGKGEDLNDVATLEQTLTRKGDVFVQGNDEYKPILMNKSSKKKEPYWDAENVRIRHHPLGYYSGDICLINQAVRYVDKLFWQDDVSFNLMEYNPKLVVLDSSGLKTLDGKMYTPPKDGNYMEYNPKLVVADSSGLKTLDGEVYNIAPKDGNYMEYNPKLVVHDPSATSGLRTLDGEQYVPSDYNILIKVKEDPFYDSIMEKP